MKPRHDDRDERKKVGEILRSIRVSSGFSRSYIASQLFDISPNTYYLYELGKTRMSLCTFLRFIKITNSANSPILQKLMDIFENTPKSAEIFVFRKFRHRPFRVIYLALSEQIANNERFFDILSENILFYQYCFDKSIKIYKITIKDEKGEREYNVTNIDILNVDRENPVMQFRARFYVKEFLPKISV